MIISINIAVFLFLLVGLYFMTEWLWDVGMQEIVIYTGNFLLEEAKKLRVKVLPEVTSTKPLDKLELLLYYSGIRNHFPFVSAKVWMIGNTILYSCCFVIMAALTGSVWKSAAWCLVLCFFITQL